MVYSFWMDKIFDKWNKIKKRIDALPEDMFFPKEGDVWIAVLGKNIGFEQNGGASTFARPVLVVKRFNNHMLLVVPLSSKQKPYDFYYNFTDPNGINASAILAQVRLVSVKRFKRKLYDLPIKDFNLIKTHLCTFFS